MVYGSTAPYPIFWGFVVIELHIFLEFKKNNSLRSKLQETVIWVQLLFYIFNVPNTPFYPEIKNLNCSLLIDRIFKIKSLGLGSHAASVTSMNPVNFLIIIIILYICTVKSAKHESRLHVVISNIVWN